MRDFRHTTLFIELTRRHIHWRSTHIGFCFAYRLRVPLALDH